MSWHLILIVGLLTLTTFWLRWRLKNKRMLDMAKKFPGPLPLPLLGNALLFVCQPEEMISKLQELITSYGDVLRIWLGPDLNIVVSNPDDLKILLTSPKTAFKGPQYKYMADFLGGGILSGSGPSWRKHRKIATPNYGKRAVQEYSDKFNSEVDILLEKLRDDRMGRVVDVYNDVVMCTTYSVCQTLMGLTREQTLKLPHLQFLVDRTHRLYDIVFQRMTKWYLQIEPFFWVTDQCRDKRSFINAISELTSAIIRHRRAEIEGLKGKVNLYTDDDSSGNTELSIVDRFYLSECLSNYEMETETFTIFTSSQEASAKIASYLLLMMAYHPKCQDKLYAEIKRVIGVEDRWVLESDFRNMPYLEMVFKEVVRLFPIGAMIQRTVQEDIVISSGTIPAGCSLVAPIYHMHRDPRFWKNPDAFDPERFTPENTKLRNPNCYLPFSLGAMDCIGRYYGTHLIKTICVRVLQEFEVTSNESYKDLKLCIAISALSLNGFKLILNRRNK